MRSLFAGSIIFTSCTILVVMMNLLLNNGLTAQRIILLAFLLGFSIFYLFLLWFYLRLRKLDAVIIFENGILNDYTKPFNKAINLKIEDVSSIQVWSGSRRITHYKIVLANKNSGRNGSLNQLKGNHIYLTDFLVDGKELYQLVQSIDLKINKSGND